MKVAEFLEQIRVKLADVKAPQLWSDDELLANLNKVLGLFLKDLPVIYYEGELTTQPNVYVYPVPKLFVAPVSVYLGTKELRFVLYNFMIQRMASGTPPGEPSWYSVFDRRFIFFPIPDREYVIRYVYRGSLLPFSVGFNDSLPVDTALLAVLEAGVLWQCYGKQDTEAFDPQAYERFKNDFFNLLSIVKVRYVRDYSISQVSEVHGGLI